MCVRARVGGTDYGVSSKPHKKTSFAISSFFFFFFLKSDFFFKLIIATLFIYFLSTFGCVGSSVRARAFSSYGKWGPLFIAVQGPLFIAVRGPLTIAAPPVAGHRLQTRRLSSCGSRAQLLRGMWDPPRPGLEPVSPALAGRLSTTAPPGKPYFIFISHVGNSLGISNLRLTFFETHSFAKFGWQRTVNCKF